MVDRDDYVLLPFESDRSPHFGAAARLYTSVWVGDNKDWAMRRHATWPGFRGLVARTPPGDVAGAVYGYTDLPGQWWHDHIAAELGPEATARWLTGSFCVTELAVALGQRRHGLGRRLLRAILVGLPHTGATLSTQTSNAPARALYESEGWRYLLTGMRFDPAGAAYAIMRRELKPGGGSRP
jgi:ribosomal protein S18 acetylase RimI-like enzyme